jgi:hypothetical protein
MGFGLSLSDTVASYRVGNQVYKLTRKVSDDPLISQNTGIKEKLLNRDELELMNSNVKNHEQSHLNALGPYASSMPLYSSIKGPDGTSYATGASIKVDLSSVPGDPEATLRKAHAIFNAAQAPHSPSSADQNTASLALQLGSLAKKELDLENSGISQETGFYSKNYSSQAETIYQSNQDTLNLVRKSMNKTADQLLDLLA